MKSANNQSIHLDIHYIMCQLGMAGRFALDFNQEAAAEAKQQLTPAAVFEAAGKQSDARIAEQARHHSVDY